MRVLKTMPNYKNSFGINLIDTLQKVVDLEVGTASFWKSSEKYAVVHIHWPEHLTFMIGKEAIPPLFFFSNLKKLETRLQYWKKSGSKLVLTLHDSQTHVYAKLYQPLFELVFEYLDGMIHLGPESKRQFIKKYPQYSHIQHQIIPHGWYDNIPNKCNRVDARKFLKIPNDHFVITAFGTIRYKAEEALIINAFKQLKMPQKTLLITNGYLFNQNLLLKKLRQIPFLKEKISERKRKKLQQYHINWQKTFVAEEEIQIYLNAADLLFIPRINLLNSGNLPLAFTFKKTVVGPDIGNIGALLKATGNPVFDPENIDSIVQAIERAKGLIEQNQGLKNYEYAQKNWNWTLIGQAHLMFYKQLLLIN